MRTRRKPALFSSPVILLSCFGLVLLVAGLLWPAGRTAIARALSLGDSTAWLEMVDKPSQIYTEYPLAHLSGRLIIFGAVKAPKCPNGGLNEDTDANECGLSATQPQSNEWQNRYNAAIIATSKNQNIPPRLLKNIFTYESQFWSETIYTTAFEYGLGHVTMNGADSALRWDPALFTEICAASFSKETCEKDGYGDQPEELRNALQGMLVQKINGDCSTCRFNQDFKQIENSIPYIGRVLQANGAYVRYAINVFTGHQATELVGSDDLWRFTLTAYNAGPGCFRSALSNVYYRGLTLNWRNLKAYLEPACKGAISYVDFVSKTDAYHPENDPALHPTPTTPAQPTATPVPVALDVPHVDNQVVVKINPAHLDSALKTLQGLNISKDQISSPIDAAGSRVIQVPPDKLKEILAGLRSDPDIASAEPNYYVKASSTNAYPNDPLFPGQANLTAVQVPAAWTSLGMDGLPAQPGAPVLVAVVDSGVDIAHEDLAAHIWSNPGETNCSDGIDDDHNGYIDDCNGWNFTARNKIVTDDTADGHGTGMAGIIGAVTNNTPPPPTGIGIAGIAPNAQILPVKVLLSNGVGTHSWAAEGIIYAAKMGARVIYLGFASPVDSDILKNAIAFAVSKGAIIVAPAGNDNHATIDNYPASYPGVISVGAVDNSSALAGFSTYSTHISLVAPGVNILTTFPGNLYKSISGTSPAAAHVAGVAVMLAGQTRFLNQPALLTTALLGSALDLGAAGRDSIYGFGLLRANNALSATALTAIVQITSPSPSAVFATGQSISFTGTAVDAVGTVISSSINWSSNIDGALGTGATLTTTKLTPGAHVITASVTGGTALNGGIVTLNIRVMELAGPHGKYATDTEACLVCHNTHSDTDTNALSAENSNVFCTNCHNGVRAKAVSTHGNLSSHTVFEKQEQNFELLCIQCHNPHNAAGNMFAIRSDLVVGALPSHFPAMMPMGAGTSFTALNPNNLNNLCVSCHENSLNPGSPMMGHDDGNNHHGVPSDQTSFLCINCHYHDLDGDPTTSDGFMPAVPAAVFGQSNNTLTPAAINYPGQNTATATPGYTPVGLTATSIATRSATAPAPTATATLVAPTATRTPAIP